MFLPTTANTCTELASGSEYSRMPKQPKHSALRQNFSARKCNIHPPSCLGCGGREKRQKLGLGQPRLTDHSKQMRSLRSQGQLTLATLNCTSLRNLNCLRLHWLPDNMDIMRWLPNNMDITALARATHRRTHAHTHTWGKYNQTPLKRTHACTLQVCSLRALHEGNIRAQAGTVDVKPLP